MVTSLQVAAASVFSPKHRVGRQYTYSMRAIIYKSTYFYNPHNKSLNCQKSFKKVPLLNELNKEAISLR